MWFHLGMEGWGVRRRSGPRYNSPFVQVCLLGFICFCCPGMFNALTAMGGGGQLDPSAAYDANTALYTTFAFFGLLGGGIHNLLGLRLTLFFGCSTYSLYTLSFLYYNHHHQQTLVVFAGALLGCGAALLWTCQGAIMTSYPLPSQKGTFISLFWTIFNLGGVLGGLIPFLLNFHRSDASASVTDSTYLVFTCFMSAGALLSLALLPQRYVVRGDGSYCSYTQSSSFRRETKEILKLLRDWRMQLIAPAAWASNFFYSYQFNVVNAVLFNLRSRGFNNVFYWLAQMAGSVAVGYILDVSSSNRRKRGFIGICVVSVIGMVIWGGGLALQLTYSESNLPSEKLDFHNSGRRFAGPFVLYLCYGLMDAMFQSLVYWIIGSLTDDGEILSRYCGFYKGVQSGGAAVAWQLGKGKLSFLGQLIVNWSLITVSFPLLALLVLLAVDNDNEDCNIKDTHYSG